MASLKKALEASRASFEEDKLRRQAEEKLLEELDELAVAAGIASSLELSCVNPSLTEERIEEEKKQIAEAIVASLCQEKETFPDAFEASILSEKHRQRLVIEDEEKQLAEAIADSLADDDMAGWAAYPFKEIQLG
jgi:hypothetical protein